MATFDLSDASEEVRAYLYDYGMGKALEDPVDYATHRLHVTLTPQQAEIARSLLEPPFRVKVDSGHNVGKTFLAAVLVNWWFDRFNPGVVITTAPTERDVIDLLWTEVRLLRQRAGLSMPFIGGRAPEMRTSDDHYAKGYTARKGESFQGRHRERMLFVFDEAEGVEANYWTAAKTMFRPGTGDAWLAIGNPTTTTSQSYLESLAVDATGNPLWKTLRLSSLDHPNIAAGLAGEPLPVSSAVTVAQVDQWVADWTELVPDEDHDATDFQWRGRWYRPGPIAEARILGRRPSAGTYGVWSESLWDAACRGGLTFDPLTTLPEIGSDVARFGDDFTAIHVRWGPCSISHEEHNGWSTVRTAGRLKELARELAAKATAARDRQAKPVGSEEIVVKIDDDGVGGGVVDQGGDGYCFLPISAASSPRRGADYPNRRSELWFDVAGRSRLGQLDLSRLPREWLAKLRIQAMAPTWKLDAAGRRVVEPKDKTKETIGRSPDGMDAVNLAYAVGSGGAIVSVGKTVNRLVEIQQQSSERRERVLPGRERGRKLFGR
jgi:hypothetical protein